MSKRWPSAIAAAGVTWYASESLRHRREQRRHGYRLRGEDIELGSDAFLRTAEALTSSPISYGNHV